MFDRKNVPPANKISVLENQSNATVWKFKASDVDKMGGLSFQFDNSGNDPEARK